MEIFLPEFGLICVCVCTSDCGFNVHLYNFNEVFICVLKIITAAAVALCYQMKVTVSMNTICVEFGVGEIKCIRKNNVKFCIHFIKNSGTELTFYTHLNGGKTFSISMYVANLFSI